MYAHIFLVTTVLLRIWVYRSIFFLLSQMCVREVYYPAFIWFCNHMVLRRPFLRAPVAHFTGVFCVSFRNPVDGDSSLLYIFHQSLLL